MKALNEDDMEDQVPTKKISGMIRSKTILPSKIQNKKMSLDEDQQFEDDQNYPNQTLKQSKGSNENWVQCYFRDTVS